MYSLLKRVGDIFLSLLAIFVFLIPWIFIALIIKIQSPGPVIYKAKRVGVNGRVFVLYKFRTMRIDSGKIRTTTLQNDDRVFAFGKILRKSKLDETLQLFNILKGDMSIIGPRPEDEVNANEMFLGEYEKILSVKPGLSSPASLYDYTHGEKYSSIDQYEREFIPQKLQLELYYVNHRGVFYDCKLICKTVIIILAILFGKEKFNVPKELNQGYITCEKEKENV